MDTRDRGKLGMNVLDRVKSWIGSLTEIGLAFSAITIVTVLTIGNNLPFFKNFSFAFLQSGAAYIYFFNVCLMMMVGYFRIAKLGLGPASEVKSETAVELFLVRMLRQSLLTPALLTSLSCLLIYFWETTAATLASVVAAVILGHCFVTQYRVGRGLFGSNKQEAVELIGLMMRHAHDSGTPPGSRLAKAYSTNVVGQESLGQTHRA